MCDVYISQYVVDEAETGNPVMAAMRLERMRGCSTIDGSGDDAVNLAEALVVSHAIPATEATDAFHIVTAAVNGIDVLLTWNCRHMANPVTLPKTVATVLKEGFSCPVIITQKNFWNEERSSMYEDRLQLP